jgi:hypothetical protein
MEGVKGTSDSSSEEEEGILARVCKGVTYQQYSQVIHPSLDAERPVASAAYT